ncbi:MAG: hypothetical protein GVY31_12080 [Alphaproteobacteria bacterium]|jgi:hypothetical protein|nr:hypothetical protein [Alphaproteobacteria bacterium]
MTLLTRPGIYQRPVRPTRRIGGIARRDIPVFVGFTTRGPAMEPIRIESQRQFAGVFGAPYPTSLLPDAVKGFFETGGTTAYVVRLVGGGAVPAAAGVTTAGLSWAFSARTRVADLANLRAGEVPMQWQDHLIRTYGQSIPDPGAWGNGLTLRVSHDPARARAAETDADNRRVLFPVEMAGFETGALVQVVQGAEALRAVIERADPLRREVVLDRDLPAGMTLGPDHDVTMSVQAISAEVLLNGQRVELFEALSPSPFHADFIAAAVNRESRFLSVEVPDGVDPAHEVEVEGDIEFAYPAAGDYTLSGGVDGLKAQGEADWLAALQAQKIIDEIALVAAPDLVRQKPVETEEHDAPLPAPNLCHLPIAQPKGAIAARVEDAETGAGIEEVRIEAAGEGQSVESGDAGLFLLENISIGLVELRLSAEGYLPANVMVQASADQDAASLSHSGEDIPALRLIPRDDIPALDTISIEAVQRAMVDPFHVGDFRIAVLDPPTPAATPEDLLNWVASLGRTARGFAAGPWIGLGDAGDDALRMQPPSGHVCGAFAVAELGQGVHRAPGNVPLRHVKSVPLTVGDAIAGEFHRASLNLITPTPGRGIRLMGGRTLSSDLNWQHANVRRLFDALERTLLSRLNWAVFETNSVATRQILKFSIEQLLERMRRRGMFAGSTAEAAYSVICDAQVNPPAGQARGELVAEIAIAPTQPYEFISFSLSAQADAIEVTEQK